MKICLIGKYPPIQGGVSTRTYWLSHDLAKRGHQVHVVTNAKEVEPPYRMTMTEEDWQQLEKKYSNNGYVKVHHTNSVLAKQYHIPWHNPFATKLASKAIKIIREYDVEVIFSYYLEPYGVAGHLASHATNIPHVVKHAGSDAGRLWQQEDFKELYDEILRDASCVITGSKIIDKLEAIGVNRNKLALGLATNMPEVFRPCRYKNQRATWLPTLGAGTKIIGIYGKLGLRKGTFDILHAIKLLKKQDNIHLIIVGYGEDDVQAQIDHLIKRLAIKSCVTQIPYIPNWKIPEFIHSCDVVCFLEQNFPIEFHSPTVAQEVLACHQLLICSLEIISKQPYAEKLIDGHNCIIVDDVTNHKELAGKIKVAITLPKQKKDFISENGYQYYCFANKKIIYPDNFIDVLKKCIDKKDINGESYINNQVKNDFLLSNIIAHNFNIPDINVTPMRSLSQLIKNISKHPDSILLNEIIQLEKQIYLTRHLLTKKGGNEISKHYAHRLGLIKNNFNKYALLNIPLKLSRYQFLKHYKLNINQILKHREKNIFPNIIDDADNYVLTYPIPSSKSVGISVFDSEIYRILKSINGKNTVNELSEKLELDIGRLDEVIKRLLRLGVVSCVG